MEQIKLILESQQEVNHLTYFIVQDDKTGVIRFSIGTIGIVKKYLFLDESSCLNKISEILSNLKSLEKWAIARIEREDNVVPRNNSRPNGRSKRR